MFQQPAAARWRKPTADRGHAQRRRPSKAPKGWRRKMAALFTPRFPAGAAETAEHRVGAQECVRMPEKIAQDFQGLCV